MRVTEAKSELGEANTAHLPKLARAPVCYVEGATFKIHALNSRWAEQSLISPEEIKSKRLITDVEFKRDFLLSTEDFQKLREGLSPYVCHDMRIIRFAPDGELELLVCQRLEPGAASNLHFKLIAFSEESAFLRHKAPINGALWTIGGREIKPNPGSEFQKSGDPFDLYDSALFKTHQELGVRPDQISGIYHLGLGETHFEKHMTYYYGGKPPRKEMTAAEMADNGIFKVDVEMPAPQRTFAVNLALLLDSDVELRPNTVNRIEFVRQADFDESNRENIRKLFLDYELEFIKLIFDGAKALRRS